MYLYTTEMFIGIFLIVLYKICIIYNTIDVKLRESRNFSLQFRRGEAAPDHTRTSPKKAK